MKNSLKIWGWVIGGLVLAVILWYLRYLILYIAIATVISLIGRPLFTVFDSLRIGRFRLPRSLSAALVLVVFIGLFAGFFSLFIPLIVKEIRVLASIDPDSVLMGLRGPIHSLEEWMHKYQLSPHGNFSVENYIRDKFVGLVDLSELTYLFRSLMGKLGGAFVWVFSVLFITFFFLKERDLLSNIVFAVTPPSKAERIKRVLDNTKRLLTRYFVGILFQIMMITLVATIGLGIIGIEHALVIAFLAGLVNIIPYLGPLIGAAIGIVIGVSTNLQLDFYQEIIPLIGEILVVFAIVQILDNFFFQPMIFSNSTNSHPLEVFLVIMTGASFAGIPGMIIAMPVYTFIRIVAKEFLSEFRLVRNLTRDL